MKKRLLLLPLCFLLIPTALKSSWFGKAKPESSDDLIEALELASLIKNQESMFGNLFDPNVQKPEKQPKHPLNQKILDLKKDFNTVETVATTQIKSALNQTAVLLLKTVDKQDPSFEKYKQSIIKELQTIYKSFFTGLQLNRGLLNRPLKPYLNIHQAFDKLNQNQRDNIKNILSLFWIKYIEKFDNNPIEISFLRTGNVEQKLKFSPLRWAYFTAHSGKGFTENQLLDDYSKPCIKAMFGNINEKADVLLKKIKTAINNPNLNKCNLLAELKPMLSDLYRQLLLKKQINHSYFQLFPEFQDAFPVISRGLPGKKPELPTELAITLTKIAEIWLKLMMYDIITKEEAVKLIYPEIIDKKTGQAVDFSAKDWQHSTACAGYNGWTKNEQYEQLIQEPNYWTEYATWLTNLPEAAARGVFDKFFNWTDESFDPSVFNS